LTKEKKYDTINVMKGIIILIICIFVCFSCSKKSPEQIIQLDQIPEFLETRYFPDHMEWLKLSEEEKLNIIFSDFFDKEIVKNMLGTYLENFLEMFQSTEVKEISGNIIIEGFMPAGNRFTNGIIKIDGNYINILFGYFENNHGLYIYFTNSFSDVLPKEFFEWRHFPKSNDIEIKKIE
jgi:hypothetical protein